MPLLDRVSPFRVFDKLILGACALWLTGAAAGLADRAPDEAARRDLERALAVVEAHFAAGPRVASPRAPGWADALRARLLAAPEAPALWPAWVVHRRPALLFDLVARPKPPPFRHEAADEVTATVERGRVTVRWAPGATAHVLVDAAVERRRDGGAWEALGAAAGEVVDEGVVPGARYAYRLVTLARPDEDDLAVRAARAAGTFQALDPALVRRESAPSPEAEAPPELYVVPLSVDADPLRPDAGSAYVVVHRWDRGARRFETTRLRLKVGQALPRGGEVLDEVGAEAGALWVRLRLPGGEARREDSRRDRLPAELR